MSRPSVTTRTGRPALLIWANSARRRATSVRSAPTCSSTHTGRSTASCSCLYAMTSGKSTSTHRSEDGSGNRRSEEHTSELQSQSNLVCRLLLEKKKKKKHETQTYQLHKRATVQYTAKYNIKSDKCISIALRTDRAQSKLISAPSTDSSQVVLPYTH